MKKGKTPPTPLLYFTFNFIFLSHFHFRFFLPAISFLTCHLFSCFLLGFYFWLIRKGFKVCCPNRRANLQSLLGCVCVLGRGCNRGLPSDYTGGMGLEYSPEGRQLSISDNCGERDWRARVWAKQTCRQPHPTLLFFHSWSCVNLERGGIT